MGLSVIHQALCVKNSQTATRIYNKSSVLLDIDYSENLHEKATLLEVTLIYQQGD